MQPARQFESRIGSRKQKHAEHVHDPTKQRETSQIILSESLAVISWFDLSDGKKFRKCEYLKEKKTLLVIRFNFVIENGKLSCLRSLQKI